MSKFIEWIRKIPLTVYDFDTNGKAHSHLGKELQCLDDSQIGGEIDRKFRVPRKAQSFQILMTRVKNPGKDSPGFGIDIIFFDDH